MKLSRIAVQNYARLADFDLEVREHLIFIGPNDVGKSSLLRLLDLLLGASVPQLYAQLSAADLRDQAGGLVVEATFSDLDATEIPLFPDEITIEPTDGTKLLVVRLEVTVDADGTLGIHRHAPDSGHGRQLSREQLQALGWRMVGASSRERELTDTRNRSLQGILAGVDLGTEAVALTALAKAFQKKLATAKSLTDLRSDLSSQLTRALPIDVPKDNLSFVSGALAADDILKDVELHIGPPGKGRSIIEQSDGTRALFAMALYDLASADANIVAVDEPETHLHPTSQRSLARLLKNGPNQKVVATHSTDIVGAFDPESVVTVKPGGIVVQPARGFLSNQARMVAKWWMRDKLEPLTARTIIGVEGISDRIVVDAVAQATGRDLDRVGVSVLETGGAGEMGAVLTLFGPKGFGVDLALLIDEDARKDTAKKLGVKPAELEQHSVWVSQRDLEDEYVAAIGATSLWKAIEDSGLFTKNERSNCAATGPNKTRTSQDVAAFCRLKNSYKVRAAIVVADLLDEKSARAITSVEGVLSSTA